MAPLRGGALPLHRRGSSGSMGSRSSSWRSSRSSSRSSSGGRGGRGDRGWDVRDDDDSGGGLCGCGGATSSRWPVVALLASGCAVLFMVQARVLDTRAAAATATIASHGSRLGGWGHGLRVEKLDGVLHGQTISELTETEKQLEGRRARLASELSTAREEEARLRKKLATLADTAASLAASTGAGTGKAVVAGAAVGDIAAAAAAATEGGGRGQGQGGAKASTSSKQDQQEPPPLPHPRAPVAPHPAAVSPTAILPRPPPPPPAAAALPPPGSDGNTQHAAAYSAGLALAAAGGVPGAPQFKAGASRPSLVSEDGLLVKQALPLVVGGTDGSGTRSVVALLKKLGVAMVVEDEGTMDVHAQYMKKGGWPPVVNPVLEQAKSAAYDVASLPRGVRDETVNAVNVLKDHMVTSSRKLRGASSLVTWGLKAPVSMLLVPFFHEAWSGVRFLHVVRDGRDLAFSGNQSPVEKFYDINFPQQGHLRKETKAMRLWNEWNVDLFEWAKQRRDGSSFDYLLLHTEDLLSDPVTKFAALKDVSEFVGSGLSDEALCCIAHEANRDMGSHSRNGKAGVTQRFGKWKAKVQQDPALGKELQRYGERGLAAFGYEPMRVARLTAYDCSSEPEGRCSGRPNVLMPKTAPDTRHCKDMKIGFDYKGADILYVLAADHLECCEVCHEEDRCSTFTYDYASGVCYVKSGGTLINKKDLVSGSVSR